jgi:hypothetical protein
MAWMHDRKVENTRRLADAARPHRSLTSMYSNVGLPTMKEAPIGARVLEARGPYAVALALNGMFIGLFLRS